MTRENLTRPVGNPVNVRAQPKEPLLMQWPAAEQAGQSSRLFYTLLAGLVLLSISPLIFRYLARVFVIDFSASLFIQAIILIVLCRICSRIGMTWVWTWLCVYTFLLDLYPNLAVAAYGLVLLIPVLMNRFVAHYVTICSAAPVDFATAKSMRKSGQLPATIKPAPVFESLLDSIRSWFTYNHMQHSTTGICQSPAGSQGFRLALTAIAVTMTTGAIDLLLRLPPGLLPFALSPLISPLLYFTPLPLLLVFITLPSISTICKARALKKRATLPNYWEPFIADMQQSPNQQESQSIFQGQVKFDGSPILNDASTLERHLWLVGSGKTTYLMVLLEQLIARGYSVLCLDLKADSFELLETLTLAASTSTQQPKTQFLSNRFGHATYLFSPFRQKWWPNLSVSQKTDILLSSTGICFSRRSGYFSDVSYHLLDHVITKYPAITSFQELNTRVAYELANAGPSELSAAVKRDSEHVAIIINRLAKTEFFNFDAATSSQQQNSALDLQDLFENQRLVYAGLNCLADPTASPELARVIFGSILACATTAKTRNQELVVVIDEFQQMVAPATLQLAMRQARSLGVSMILANQTVADLGDFAAIVESSTATQLWFKASGQDAIAQIQALGGKVIEHLYSQSVSHSENGTTTSYTTSEALTDRFQPGDIAAVSADECSFIIRISDDRSYAQYSGLPFVGKYDYHLNFAEYQARTQAAWPQATTETIVVSGQPQPAPIGRTATPVAPPTPPQNSAVRSGSIGHNRRPQP